VKAQDRYLPSSRCGPATSTHPLTFHGREEGDAAVLTRGKRKEAELNTAMSKPNKEE
jgi:hypothetical protein